MRKRIIGSPGRSASDPNWLNLEGIAEVEITSEDRAHPIESAMQPGAGPGWRAEHGGEQIIRIVFDQPQRLQRIRLRFVETDVERTQECLLRWSGDRGLSFRDIARQQWNFSPSGSTRELEDYRVDLSGVTVLELQIVPDQRGGDARASMAEIRLG